VAVLVVAGAARLRQSDVPMPVPAQTWVEARRCSSVGFPGTPPTKTGDVTPVYPAEALRKRVSGVVIIETTIDERGDVAAARVVRSIPLLDAAALDAVKRWKFSPAMLRGAPACVTMTVSVTFGPQA
jgi:protein TonB